MSDYIPSNRNSLRKIYSINRVVPDLRTLGSGEVIDANRQSIHRDFYVTEQRTQFQVSSSVVYGIYEDDYIHLNHETTKSIIFSQTFPVPPIVVLSLEDNTGLENIVPFLSSLNVLGATVNVSSEYSGSIRYRAIYSATYPATVFDNPNNPSTILNITATSVDLTNSTLFTASYPSVGHVPIQSFLTLYGLNDQGNVNISSESVGEFINSGHLSSEVTGQLYFLGIG
jgi:hypothetical protein